MPADSKQVHPAVDPTLEEIAKAVAAISDGVKRMRAGKLNDKALILLISHSSNMSQGAVRAVLDGMEGLQKYYFKKGTA